MTYAYFANIMQNAIPAGYRNFKGKVKNFFSNLYSKKGSVKITGNASFSTVSGELLIYECNTSSKSDILTINAFDKNAFAGNIKDFIDSPVFVTSDCISMSIKVLSVEVSEDKKGIATLSIGLSAPLPPGVSAGFQIQFSASVNDGKYGTFENGKDPEINQRVNNFNKTSEKVRDGYIMCFGGSL